MLSSRESEARAILKSVFGYEDFRPGQWEVIAAALAGPSETVWSEGSQLDFYHAPAQVDPAVARVSEHFRAPVAAAQA